MTKKIVLLLCLLTCLSASTLRAQSSANFLRSKTPTTHREAVHQDALPPKRDEGPSPDLTNRIPQMLTGNRLLGNQPERTSPSRTETTMNNRPAHSAIALANYESSSDLDRGQRILSSLSQIGNSTDQSDAPQLEFESPLNLSNETLNGTVPTSDDRTLANKRANRKNALDGLVQKTIWNTALVIALAIGTVLVLKLKGKHRKPGQTPVDEFIEVLSTTKIGGKSILHLVKVGKQQVLVASDANGIKSVISLDSKQSFNEVMEHESIEPTLDSNENRAGLGVSSIKDFLAEYKKNSLGKFS